MKDYQEFFWLALLASCFGGGFLGAGEIWLGAYFLAISANSLTLKWIFITMDERRAKKKWILEQGLGSS